MKIKLTNRQYLFAALVIFYLMPLLFFSSYSIGLMPAHKSWIILSFGLLMISIGTLILMLLLYYWEKSISAGKSDFLNLQPTIGLLTDKQDKVTSLDPLINLKQTDYESIGEQKNYKESLKELNLLEASLKESQEQYEELFQRLEIKQQEMQKLETDNQLLQQKSQQIAQDFADYKLFSDEQLKQKQLQLSNLQQVIEDQRSEVEKRQEQIHQLDTKVHDLSYEIKTLLYLNEEEPAKGHSSKTGGILSKEIEMMTGFEDIDQDLQSPEHAIQSPNEAIHLLKKCIHVAQKLTGANYYTNESSRYREFSSSYYAIDQRRLFDSLRNESRALVIVYSPKESKIVFANNESKKLLGWKPEKFVADFPHLIQDGLVEWKKALSALTASNDSQIRLLVKTKYGQEILLDCHFGAIPSGIFRNYVIGILYPI